MAQLKTTYDTLTVEEKMRCIIYDERIQMVAQIIDIAYGRFSMSQVTNTYGYIYSFDLANKTYAKVGNIGSTITTDNYSSSVNTSTLNLMLLSNY